MARIVREFSIMRSYELTNKKDSYWNVLEEGITYEVFSFQTWYNLHHKSGFLLDRRVQKQPTRKLLKRGGCCQILAKSISHPGFRETGQSLVVDSSRNAQPSHTNKERWIVWYRRQNQWISLFLPLLKLDNGFHDFARSQTGTWR